MLQVGADAGAKGGSVLHRMQPGAGSTAAVGAVLFLSTHFFLLGTGMDEITAGLPLPRKNKNMEGFEGIAL